MGNCFITPGTVRALCASNTATTETEERFDPVAEGDGTAEGTGNATPNGKVNFGPAPAGPAPARSMQVAEPPETDGCCCGRGFLGSSKGPVEAPMEAPVEPTAPMQMGSAQIAARIKPRKVTTVAPNKFHMAFYNEKIDDDDLDRRDSVAH
eukprot:gnl/TRDRNA2_/TRDRNA2_143373_c0_seq1.p2 gnl/TRDRNA2_/TRDRNA2_143373_c0~~gnl/TRDRNA2_/TRDRNA2_143373_c0_seq1.p2  ORF type:complete len:151 (-),score=21.63 gnl/TRDRNA2_/TRDRNA2_143373_c0_seq1:118-570(-)